MRACEAKMKSLVYLKHFFLTAGNKLEIELAYCTIDILQSTFTERTIYKYEYRFGNWADN